MKQGLCHYHNILDLFDKLRGEESVGLMVLGDKDEQLSGIPVNYL